MFLVIRKQGGGLQPRPLRKSPSRALVSDDVNLGNTLGKIIALYLHVVCLQVCELTFTGLPNNKTFCTKSSLPATSHTKALLRLHYAVEQKNHSVYLFVSAEHRRYINTLYNIFYYIQTCGGKTRTEQSDSLHRILSDQRQEKTCRKKPSYEKKIGRKSE